MAWPVSKFLCNLLPYWKWSHTYTHRFVCRFQKHSTKCRLCRRHWEWGKNYSASVAKLFWAKCRQFMRIKRLVYVFRYFFFFFNFHSFYLFFSFWIFTTAFTIIYRKLNEYFKSKIIANMPTRLKHTWTKLLYYENYYFWFQSHHSVHWDRLFSPKTLIEWEQKRNVECEWKKQHFGFVQQNINFSESCVYVPMHELTYTGRKAKKKNRNHFANRMLNQRTKIQRCSFMIIYDLVPSAICIHSHTHPNIGKTGFSLA